MSIKVYLLVVLCVLVATIKSATVNVAPGDDTLKTAIGNVASGSVLSLKSGFYNLLTITTGVACAEISKPLTILGV